jgi:hypothetical protein
MFLNCTYQITFSISFTFWYVQYLHEAPQLLLKSSTESQRTENKGFQATLVKSNSSFHLQKSSLLLSDSAVYYCAVRDTVRGAAGGAGRKPRRLNRAVPGGEGYVLYLGRVYTASSRTRTISGQIPRILGG